MYADMGHFGCLPMRLGWFGVVLPALVLNYFGQGALLLSNPQAIENPFYLLAPDWLHYPMIAFATIATIIASQAVISGAYSLTQQAIQLGFLPRLRVLHTASHEKGQIYMPMVNWLLAAGTLGAIVMFGSSDALGGAYGIAVSLLMAITTVLAALVALHWGYHPILIVAVNGVFLIVDLIFVSANATKLFEGGWFPLLLAGIVAFLMLTWRTGYKLLERQRSRLREREDEFVSRVLESRPIRLTGAAAIFTAASSGIPLALTRHLSTTVCCTSACCLDSHDRRAADRSRTAGEADTGRRGHHPRAPLLWVYGTSQYHGRTATGLPRPRPVRYRPGEDYFLLTSGHGCPNWQNPRHGSVAGEAVRGDAPERQSARCLFRCTDCAGRRGRARGRDLSLSGVANLT